MFRAGIVAAIGQPNVGKSTLINAIVGQKVSIVSSKPQTTRRRAIGIYQSEVGQIVFVDTPGIHEPHTRLGKVMVDQARGSLDSIDAILVVVDAARLPNELDRQIAKLALNAAKVEREIPTSKPDGTPRKVLDVTRLAATGWKPKIDLDTGVRETYQWFLDQEAANIDMRGIDTLAAAGT